MNIKLLVLTALLLACDFTVAGSRPFTSNPASPYPPGCATETWKSFDVTDDHVAHFYSRRIDLEVDDHAEGWPPSFVVVNLDMYRVACSEANRSLIVADFTVPEDGLPPLWDQINLILPWVAGANGGDAYPLEFKSDPNTWGQPFAQTLLSKRAFGAIIWGAFGEYVDTAVSRNVLDVRPQESSGDRDDVAKFYNSEFELEFYRSDGTLFHSVLVPSTETVLDRVDSLPLSGRLSGNWVEEGSADQGLLLSFGTGASLLAPGGGISAFLSWFTYDAEGELLWLTGYIPIKRGISEARIPIQRVLQGTFMGNTTAQRSTVGSAVLRAIDCNRMELEYDLDSLGLGSDVMVLQRLFALEIADYPCRDYEGLQSSIFPPESN